MKERTLLDLMAQIDDDFIAEAAHPEILLAAQRKKRRAQWIKRISSVAACMIVAVGIVSAVPYLRVMSREEDAVIRDEINAAVNQSQAVLPSSADAEFAQDIQSDEAERIAAEESLKAANEAAEKAAKEAADKASAAEKAAAEAKKEAEAKAAEASKQAAEASKQAVEASKLASTAYSDSVQEQDGVDQVSFVYSDHILISFTVDAGYHLEELILPEEMKGNVITMLDQDFWRFCDLHSPNLKHVVIPSTIVEFGDITFLSREVEILCEKGSAAEIFFTAQGYTVKLS